MSTEPQKIYDESDFDVLEGLEPVRKVPGMYTRTKNTLHILQEVLDNAVDEAQNGHASKISLTIHEDNSVSVADNGRGIPVGLHAHQKIPVVVLAFTRLHAGAKFRKGNSYSRSGGLHGVGVAVTNALSSTLVVQVRREAKIYQVTFTGGDKEISEVTQIGECDAQTTGTTVRFWPDPQFFETITLPLGELTTLLRSKAMLLPGLEVEFINECTGEKEDWRFNHGLEDYLRQKLEGREIIGTPFIGEGRLSLKSVDPDHEGLVEHKESSLDEQGTEGDGAAWALAWTSEPGGGESYVNLIPTPLGGTHEAGLRSGLFESLRSYCEAHSLLPRGVTLQAEDVWRHAQFILSAHIMHTQFQGQTKDKLTSREAVRIIASVVKTPLMNWLISNPDSAKLIADHVIKQASERLKQGKVIEKRKSSGMATLPGKLTDCQLTDSSRNELLLVEGNSAGGGCKTARDRTYQAILPLRGKVLNTWEVPIGELFGNQEVHDISVALGVDPHTTSAGDEVLSSLRYGKVIILSDADVDGSHIQTLLLTLFYKHFPKLIDNGHVFIAKPPLFRIDAPAKGKSRPAQKIYCLTEEERDATIHQLLNEGFKEEQLMVSRFKGLGEMMPAQLKDTVLNPDTRLLLPLAPPVRPEVDKVFNLLMAKGESGSRRKWLEEKGDQAEVDL